MTASKARDISHLPIRVFMMDLLSIVPYYTGHLCSALKQVDGLDVQLGSITYHLDREFFNRQGIKTNPGAFDVISKTQIPSVWLRRFLKTAEWLVNMTALSIRFAFSKPDVIHVQFMPMLSAGLPLETWFLKLAKLQGIKIVYTVHNILPHDSGLEQKAVFQQIYSLADRLICHDEPAKLRLIDEFGISPRKISIVAHGPLFAKAEPSIKGTARKRLGIPEQQVLVLWQGILRPYKGVPFLLSAWDRVTEAIGTGPACLAVVGNGEHQLQEELRALVSGLRHSSSVKLDLRFIPVEEMNDLYSDADIVVYPYSDVTTSGALMTGIAQSKAIIATNLPAFSQLLRHNENGLLVNYGQVEEFAAAIKLLIKDASLRNRLGQTASSEYSGQNQWDEIASQTLACYQTALDRTI